MIWTGILDAWKYIWQAQAIRKIGTAKGHSRRFINAALHSDHVKTLYLIGIGIVNSKVDWYLLSSAVVALFTMSYLWYTIYLLYPYRQRGLMNFKRPNIFVYLVNSLIPNNLRKRL